MDRRRALTMLAGLGVTGLSAACGGNTAADDGAAPLSDIPVKIGLLVPETGGFKAIGDDITKGFQLFIDLHGGRLGGHKVLLQTADEGATDKAAKAAMDQLLNKGVDAVTGVVNSSSMLAVRDAIRTARVPLVGSNGSPESLKGEVYIWRTSFVDNEVGQAMGGYLASQTTGRVASVVPGYSAGTDAALGFQETFGKDPARLVEVVTGPETNPGKRYFTPAIDQIRAANADAVFCYFAGPAAVEFVKEYRAAGLKAKLYAAGFVTEGDALKQLDTDAAGIMTGLNYSADLPNAANRIFSAAYRKKHGTSPTTYAMASYDAAQVLDRAIQLTGENMTALEINRMLGKVGQVDSPRGTWQFNQSRTPQQKWYLREVRKDGRVLSNVLISELATLG